MNNDNVSKLAWLLLGTVLIFALAAFTAYSSIAEAAGTRATLAGDQEVQPLRRTETGTATIIGGTGRFELMHSVCKRTDRILYIR